MNAVLDPQIRELRILLERREEELRQLKEATRSSFVFPSEVGLTLTEGRIVTRMLSASPGVLSTEQLMVICAKNPERQPCEKTIHVHVSRIRRKLAPYDIVIRNVREEGYGIEKDSASRLRSLMQ